ncbi:hypothetical protein [Devosia aurantiaca]|nr:hypothetical protein [Devosia aurantiaca]
MTIIANALLGSMNIPWRQSRHRYEDSGDEEEADDEICIEE